MKYNIGGIGFATKEKALAYTRNIIKECGYGHITEGKSFDYLMALFKLHPNAESKIGCGVQSILIQVNYYKNGDELYIYRTDGTKIDISWNQCCLFGAITINVRLKDAMRLSVDSHINDYKRTQPAICVYCGSTQDIEIDHHQPSFLQLYDQFVKHKTLPTKFDDDDKTNRTLFKPEDIQFKTEWIQHHNTKCNLQVLCGQCNRRKCKK